MKSKWTTLRHKIFPTIETFLHKLQNLKTISVRESSNHDFLPKCITIFPEQFSTFSEQLSPKFSCKASFNGTAKYSNRAPLDSNHFYQWIRTIFSIFTIHLENTKLLIDTGAFCQSSKYTGVDNFPEGSDRTYNVSQIKYQSISFILNLMESDYLEYYNSVIPKSNKYFDKRHWHRKGIEKVFTSLGYTKKKINCG